MSHVATIELEIKDLDALRKAGEALGLVWSEKKTYRWYGRSVGDTPLPPGMTEADLGKCDFCLSIPGNAEAYELGVVRKADGTYTLAWDYWNKGFGLQDCIGKGGAKIRQEYAVEVARKQLARAGRQVQVVRQTDGSIKIIGS